MAERIRRRYYIRHEDIKHPDNGIAYFGPFLKRELTERLNDRYANLLADGSDLDEAYLSDEEARAIYINPKSYWMEQLHRLEAKDK